MNLLYFMIPASLILSLIFLVFFIWSVRKGQYDDLETPAHRILFENESKNEEQI